MRLVLLLHIGLIVLINTSCKKIEITQDIIVLGHAGASLSPERAVYPPNSLQAIGYAMDVLGADGVEVDVQLTQDGQLVLFHDDFMDETTNQEGCIANYSLNELKNTRYHLNYTIAELTSGISEATKRSKYIMLDIKHYDFCNEKFIDFELFNSALNSELEKWSVNNKKRIIVNARNLDLLNALTDTVIVKSFETPRIDEGIELVTAKNIDLLTLKRQNVTTELAAKMRANAVPFCIFGVKTKAEVKEAIAFLPNYIISDNVAHTQKKLNH